MVAGLVILIGGISLTMAVIAGSILMVDRKQQLRRNYIRVRIYNDTSQLKVRR